MWFDEHDDDAQWSPGPLLPPEDRLWRHPSEVQFASPPPPPKSNGRGRSGLVIGLAAVGCLVLTLGVLLVSGVESDPNTTATPPAPEKAVTTFGTTASTFASLSGDRTALGAPTPKHGRLGIEVIDDAGVQVVAVSPGGAAEEAGIRPTDRILAVNDQRVDRATTLLSVLDHHEPGDTVEVTVERAGTTLSITTTLG